MKTNLWFLCCLFLTVFITNCEKETFATQTESKPKHEKCPRCASGVEGPDMHGCSVGETWFDNSCIVAHTTRTFTVDVNSGEEAFWSVTDPTKFAFVDGIDTGETVEIEALAPTVNDVSLRVVVGNSDGLGCISNRKLCATCPVSSNFDLRLSLTPVPGQACVFNLNGLVMPRLIWGDIYSVDWFVNNETAIEDGGPSASLLTVINDNSTDQILNVTAVITLDSGCQITVGDTIVNPSC